MRSSLLASAIIGAISMSACSTSSHPESSIKDTQDMVSAARNTDGTFTVTCKNREGEIYLETGVKAEEMVANRTCLRYGGKPTPNKDFSLKFSCKFDRRFYSNVTGGSSTTDDVELVATTSLATDSTTDVDATIRKFVVVFPSETSSTAYSAARAVVDHFLNYSSPVRFTSKTRYENKIGEIPAAFFNGSRTQQELRVTAMDPENEALRVVLWFDFQSKSRDFRDGVTTETSGQDTLSCQSTTPWRSI